MLSQDALVVELEQDGIVGLGEVTANTYYGHSLGSIERSIESVRPWIESATIDSPATFWQTLNQEIGGDYFALCALDLAAQDWFAQAAGKKCFEVWGLEASQVCESSYTIAIDSIETMVEKLNAMPGWSVYKIKLGTQNDLEIVRELRDHTDARFRVDANCGWSVDEAIEKSEILARLGVEFIEQPMKADASEGDKRKLFERSALPLIADENCLVESDVDACHEFFHGINVKLCKCGGLTPAVRMLQNARKLGMKTMVGCMIESSIGISANAQLLPLLDFADLDGAILLGSDPAEGVTIDCGRVGFAARNGHGGRIKKEVPVENTWQPTEHSTNTN